MAFEIITLDTSHTVTASGNPIGAVELVLPDPNGGPALPVGADRPLPTTPSFGPSGVPAIVHNFTAPNEFGALFSPIPGRPFNIDLKFANGTDARLRLLRSFDQGATFSALTDQSGNPIADWAGDVSCQFMETESGVNYALEMTVHNSGSVAARISQ